MTLPSRDRSGLALSERVGNRRVKTIGKTLSVGPEKLVATAWYRCSEHGQGTLFNGLTAKAALNGRHGVCCDVGKIYLAIPDVVDDGRINIPAEQPLDSLLADPVQHTGSSRLTAGR